MACFNIDKKKKNHPQNHTLTNCDCCRFPQLHTAVWTIHPRMEESSIGRETGQAADSSITATLAIGSWVTEMPHADSIPMGFTSGTIWLHYAKVNHTIQRHSLTQSPHSDFWELPWKNDLPPRIWQNVSFSGALKSTSARLDEKPLLFH